MSENSDAVVVVVSEETGAISIARRGRLNRGISDGDLREILSKELLKNNTRENRRIIRKRGNSNE